MKIPWVTVAEFLLFLSSLAVDWYNRVNGLPANPQPQGARDVTKALRTAALVLDPDTAEDDIQQAAKVVESV